MWKYIYYIITSTFCLSQRIYISAISPSILQSLAPFNPLCHSPTIVGNPWYPPAMPARETREIGKQMGNL